MISDRQGRQYPAKTKRLAPDFSFHPQVYREDGERVRLPAGEYTVESARGPEYVAERRVLRVVAAGPNRWEFRLKRWIDPAATGWYSGDHHIHAAGCSHYEAPTQGVMPEDMIRHIRGEGLNVGSVLTWGPCYYFQKQFFEAKTNKLSTAQNLMRYDVEVSGFPSSHAGHLALLGLREQDYPGAKKIEDWPTWDLPILKWAKAQGAIVGFAHSGWGLEVKSDKLPNYEPPPFDGIGANEYIVDVTHDAVDFISAVDTPFAWELNIWYHTLNTRLPHAHQRRDRLPLHLRRARRLGPLIRQARRAARLRRVGQGPARRALVRLRRQESSDGLRRRRVLPSARAAASCGWRDAETVRVTARVAALLDARPDEAVRGRRYDQTPYWHVERARVGATREVPVEVVVNGRAVAVRNVVADGATREVSFDVRVERSSWVALRILPSSHTNPVFVIVGGQPVRASRRSAEWCLKAVDQCWLRKAPQISARERPEAAQAYEHAREVYRRILAESKED